MNEKAKALVTLQNLEFSSRRSQKEPVKPEVGTIEHLRSRVGSQLLRQYENRKRRYGATSVVPIRGDLCSGCHISLSLGTRRRAFSEVTECDHCARLVYNPARRRRLRIEVM